MSKPQRDETLPTWLDTNFVENALRQGMKNDDLKILDSEITMATAVGDNYGSQMFRFNLAIKREREAKEEKMSIIVKSIPSGLMGKELRNLAAFEKEEEAFSKTLPAINRLLETAYPGHKKLWADCYYHQGGPDNLLIFEDLRLSGFVLANRFEGLDMEHSILVLKSLAKLHAASLVLMKNDPTSSELFAKQFWDINNFNSVKNMFSTPFNVISKDVLNWPDLEKKEIYSEKLKSLGATSLQQVTNHWIRDESKVNVLLHGDSWVNNFMFRYDPNGKLNGINFVDFQMVTLNNPVMDLHYFIFTSVRPDLRFTNIDFFLKTYHEAFEDTLERLNHKLEKPFGLEDLRKNFEEKYGWGMITLYAIYPLFILPKNKAVHPDDFYKVDENSAFEKIFLNEDLRDTLKMGFQFFEEKGVF